VVDVDVGLSMFWDNYPLSLLRHVPDASVEASLHELSKLACCISGFSYVVAPHVVDSLPQALLFITSDSSSFHFRGHARRRFSLCLFGLVADGVSGERIWDLICIAGVCVTLYIV
jgi:hypothetical protein